ncbi:MULTISPECIES: glycosyltransferase [unclassified Bradyrhizobium]
MQADYFRLCYLLVEGGFYVDADDVCIGSQIDWLFGDGRLKIHPLCYDIAAARMVNIAQIVTEDHPRTGGQPLGSDRAYLLVPSKRHRPPSKPPAAARYMYRPLLHFQ